MKQGKLKDAEWEARLALPDPSTRGLAYAALGAIRFQEKRYDESAKYLREAIQINPHLVGARLNLGWVDALQGKPEEAQSVFQEALKIDPNNFAARLDLVREATANANYRVALETARPICPKLQRSDQGLLLLATIYLGLHQEGRIKQLIEHWQALPSTSPETAVSFAELLTKNRLTDAAISVLEKAKTSGPLTYALAFELGSDYLLKDDLARASSNYELAFSLNKESVPSCLQIARIADRQNNLDKALAYLLKAEGLQPNNPEVFFEFGRVCLEKNLYQDALPALEKAVKLKPDNDSYRYVLASAHVADKQFDSALKLLQPMLRAKPNDPVLNYAVGSIFYLEAHFNSAARYFRRSIALNPNQVAAYYYLGLTLEREGQADQAILLFRDLLRRYPQHGPSYVELGVLLLKKRDFSGARQVLERAIVLDPHALEAHYQLGILLARTGNNQAAQTQLAIAQKLRAAQRKNSMLDLRILNPH